MIQFKITIFFSFKNMGGEAQIHFLIPCFFTNQTSVGGQLKRLFENHSINQALESKNGMKFFLSLYIYVYTHTHPTIYTKQ